jgi:hypothetical protein
MDSQGLRDWNKRFIRLRLHLRPYWMCFLHVVLMCFDLRHFVLFFACWFPALLYLCLPQIVQNEFRIANTDAVQWLLILEECEPPPYRYRAEAPKISSQLPGECLAINKTVSSWERKQWQERETMKWSKQDKVASRRIKSNL